MNGVLEVIFTVLHGVYCLFGIIILGKYIRLASCIIQSVRGA